MKNSQLLRALFRVRILLAIVLGVLCWPLGLFASLSAALVPLLFNPHYAVSFTFPTPGGSSVSNITSVAGADAQQKLWELKLIQSAFQQSPFRDNMVGRMGSGKPVVEYSGTKTVAGSSIVLSTIDSLGAPMIQGNSVRVGLGERVKPGTFELATSIGFFEMEIDNTGMTQTVVGTQWDEVSQILLARRLAKQQNDDRLTCLKFSATAQNTKFPNGKTIDSLSTTDTFGTSLIKASAGMAKDNGTMPMNVNPNPDSTGGMEPPPIHRFMQFTTDVGARPIFNDALYLQGLSYAADRGKDNPLFTGVYMEWDNNIIYPWVNVRHGGWGSVGSPLQPEALLGVAIPSRLTASGIIPGGASSGTSGGIYGGGNATGAAVTPYVNYFENFSRYTWTPISGTFGTAGPGSGGGAIPLSYVPRATYSYVVIIDKLTGLVSYLSYTANTAAVNSATGGSSTPNLLSGITRLGSVNDTGSGGDYNTTLPGSTIVWGTAPFLTTPDNNGFLGVTDVAIAAGSLMVECNSKGVPLCFGLTLGEMALVEGYARVPSATGNGTFKTGVERVDYAYPYGQAFGRGIQVGWGCTAFQRPDGLTPNYVLTCFARALDGAPNIA